LSLRRSDRCVLSLHVNHEHIRSYHPSLDMQARSQSQVLATAQLWHDVAARSNREIRILTRASLTNVPPTRQAGQADLRIPTRKHHVPNGRVSTESHFARAPSPAHLSQSTATFCTLHLADKGDRIWPHYFRTNRMFVVRRGIVALLLSFLNSCYAHGRASGTDGRPGCREMDRETDGEKYAAGRSKQVSCTKVSAEDGLTLALIPACIS